MLIAHRLIAPALILEVATLTQALAGPATGPLKVHPQNPRYFADAAGRPVYLTGFHNWYNLQDSGEDWPPSTYKTTGHSYAGQLALMRKYHHNFMRMWAWEHRRWSSWENSTPWIDPLPWALADASYGKALDGRAKFDLTRFNQAYFDRLRARVIQARNNGVYVSIMLFQGFSVLKRSIKPPENPWLGHPFNRENNINGVDGDLSGKANGQDIHTMSDDPKIRKIRDLQEAYVKKVLDTVNDLDNVLYEIGNELDGYSREWQYYMIDFIKAYEKTKPKQHPVGMTFPWPDERGNEGLFAPACHADWVSPGPGAEGEYKNDPPPADGKKVSILDTDHLWGIGGDRVWVWKSFTRGHNPIYMDPLKGKPIDYRVAPATMEAARLAMGHTLRYAEKMNLAAATPSKEVSSTRYALGDPGKEYLVYQPEAGKSFTVNLKAGKYRLEWFNPDSGKVQEESSLEADRSSKTFKAPFAGDAVLYLKAQKQEER